MLKAFENHGDPRRGGPLSAECSGAGPGRFAASGPRSPKAQCKVVSRVDGAERGRSLLLRDSVVER